VERRERKKTRRRKRKGNRKKRRKERNGVDKGKENKKRICLLVKNDEEMLSEEKRTNASLLNSSFPLTLFFSPHFPSICLPFSSFLLHNLFISSFFIFFPSRSSTSHPLSLFILNSSSFSSSTPPSLSSVLIFFTSFPSSRIPLPPQLLKDEETNERRRKGKK
jgi:hypothetical protein